MNDANQILDAIEADDQHASEQLLPLVYDELRRLAAAKLNHEKPGQTLDATALVHEAYLRLVGSGQPPRWNSRGHFFVAAAEAMRRILVESARRKQRIRHGGQLERVELDDFPFPIDVPMEDIVAVNDALDNLARVDEQSACIVKLHYFLGVPLAETAPILGISERTAYRNWSYARAWLYKHLAP